MNRNNGVLLVLQCLVISILLNAALAHAQITPDRFEPNDSLTEAAAIGAAPGTTLDSLTIHEAGDVDWYGVELLRPDSVTVKIGFQSDDSVLTFEVVDAEGATIASGSPSDDGAEVTINSLTAGAYYVRVSGTEGSTNAYSLAIEPAPASTTRVIYVNNHLVDDLFYTTAPGDNANTGLTPGEPKASLQSVLADYTLGPNDLVLIDTGNYDAGLITITAEDEGAAYAGSPAGSNFTTNGNRFEIAGASSNLFYSLSDTLFNGTVSALLTESAGLSGRDTATYSINGGEAVSFTDAEELEFTQSGTDTIEVDVMSMSGKTASPKAQFASDPAPVVVSQSVEGHTNENVSSILLGLSEPVVGTDARAPSTYQFLNLGSDRLPGGGDDTNIATSPLYIDGTTDIELLLVGSDVINLNNWFEKDYANGASGDWRIEGGGSSVKQYTNGEPTFFVSDFDFINRQFAGRIKVETTSDDDFIGLAFGMQLHPDTGKPDSYYLLQWKRLKQVGYSATGEKGFTLIKVTGISSLTLSQIATLLWGSKDITGTNCIEMLGYDYTYGWASNVEYDFSVRYQSNGTIDISVRRSSNGALQWQTTIVDPEPLGPGPIAFYNFSQASVRYSGLQQADFLPEGAYQLTVTSGNPGIRDTDGTYLDGNNDGIPGDDYISAFVIDKTQPAITEATLQANELVVTYYDIGGIDEDTISDPDNYTLERTGGDGTFDDGNEIAVSIVAVAVDNPAAGTTRAVLAFDPPLPDEIYTLAIDGTETGARDLAGNTLAGGTYLTQLTLLTSPATVLVDLPAADDSGTYDDDNVTNVASPEVHVIVNKPGLIKVDFYDNGVVDEQLLAANAGTYPFQIPFDEDGTHTVAVDFVPAAGTAVTDSLAISIDTVSPQTEITLDPPEPDGQDGWYNTPVTVTLNATDAAPSSGFALYYRWNGGEFTQAQTLPVVLQAPLGESTLTCYSADVAGNTEDQHDITIKTNFFTLAVTSSPVANVSVTGTHSGTTTYSRELAVGEAISLTAPSTLPAGDVQAAFLRWTLNEIPQPDAQNTINIIADQSWNAEAVYTVPPPATALTTTPSQPNGTNGWFITQPQVHLNATGANVQEIHYQWNAEPETVVHNASATFNVPPGTNTLNYYAIDQYEQVEPSNQTTIKYDDSTPCIAIQLAGNEAAPGWYDTAVTATIVADGDGRAVTSVEYRIGGGEWTPYTEPVPLSADAAYTLYARMTTETGKAASTSRSFIIDTLPPLTVLTTVPSAPNGLNDWFITPVKVRLTAADSASGVNEIHYKWNDAPEYTVYAGSYREIDAPAGENVIHYFAVDNVGYAEAPQQATIKYDGSTPSVSIGLDGLLGGEYLGNNWYRGNVAASVSADADGVDIASVEIRIGSAAWEPYTTPVTVSGEGSRTVYARVTTVTGKTATTSVTFRIDRQPPVTTLTTVPSSPNGPDGWFVGRAPRVRLAASDSGVGVKEIRYYWNAEDETVVTGSYVELTAPVGENTLTYCAVDRVDQAEDVREQLVKYDDSAPDLIVSAIVVPSEAVSGGTFPVSYTVTNAGTWEASGSWVDRVFLSADNVAGGDTLLASTSVSTTVSVGGAYSRDVSVKLPDGISGDYWLVVSTDVHNAVYELDDTNNASVSDAVEVEMAPYPDLLVTEIVVPPTGLSGQEIEVSWTVSNGGDGSASGTWTDRIYLSDSPAGGGTVLASLSYGADIAPGGSTTRSRNVTLPAANIAGDRWISVRTDATNVIYELDETNNLTVAEQPIAIPPSLVLTLSVSRIAEDSATPATGTVRHNTTTENPVVVALAASLPDRLAVPESVTIPAGRNYASFAATPVNNTIADGDAAVTIAASADGFIETSAEITVVDDETPALRLVIAADEINEGGEGSTTTALVSRNTSTAEPLTVTVSTSPDGIVAYPISAIIPAEEASVSFQIEAVDNDSFDGDRRVEIIVSAAGMTSGRDSLYVVDNDTPELTLTLSAPSIVEGATNPAATGTFTRSPVTGEPVRVEIHSSNVHKARVPSSITIPANQPSAEFPISAVDNNLVDGSHTVTIWGYVTLMGVGFDDTLVSADIDVLDDDGPTLSVTITDRVISESADNPATTGTVRRNTAPEGELVVNLASSDTAALTVPTTVTIEDGLTSAAFDVNVVYDEEVTGTKNITISAGAGGFNSGSDTVEVIDINVPVLRVQSLDVPSTGIGGQPYDVAWTVVNNGLGPATGAWVDAVYLSHDNQPGQDTLLHTAIFTGTLDVSESYERSVMLALPEQPGTYWIIAVSDIGGSSGSAGNAANRTLVSSPLVVSPPYRATVEADLDTTAYGKLAVAGTDIRLAGYAYDSETGQPAGGQPVKIRLRRNGFRREINVVSELDGTFETYFRPLASETGTFIVGADHPGVFEDPAHDEFTVMGMRVDPTSRSHTLRPGEPLEAELAITNLSEIPITELAAAVVGIDDLEVEIDVPDTIAGSGSVTLTYSLEAPDTSSILTASFGIHITTAEGMASMVNINLRVTPYAPELVARPSKLRTGMVRGQQRTVQFEVTNEGGAASSGVSVLLPSEPWMTLTSPQMLPDLEPGESTLVELSLNPEADLPLAMYNGRLILSGPGVNVPVDYEFRAISDAVGDLEVTVEDEYTYFAEGAPKVEGATVKLIDLMTREVVAQAVSGADGVAALYEVREAEYELRVEADRHNTFRGGIYITPGVLTETRVFLLREIVSYSWSVVPTEIEDEYRIVLEAVFETHVPVPVVTIDSPFMVPVIVEGETTQIEIVATNHGLVSVYGIDLGLPTDHPEFVFTPLVDDIVEIPAKTTITIPVLIELREGTEFSSVDDDGCKTCGGKSAGTAATKDGVQIGGGCDEVQGCLTYYYVCGPENVWRKECLTLKPLKTAKSGWDCLKALLNEDMYTKGRKNLLDLPVWALDIVCSCLSLDKCTCAILKMLAGAASGARAGVWGAAAGAIRQLPGLWNCICFTVPSITVPDYTPRPPTTGGEWGWGSGWGWGGGSGTGSGGSPWGGSTGFSAPSGGCSEGDTRPAAVNEDGANVTYADEEPDEWEGVCARVRIQIEQRAVMTRSAFLGTLEISNEGEGVTLEGITVTLDITDEAGESADHLFGVRQPEVTGMGAVDGTGSLAPMSTGVAKFTIIPNQDAAPDEPTRFFVGGTLRYIDRDQEVTVPLFPAPITVYPSANLRLKYYLERDVYSDDPFTDEIEPAVPFSLGLMVSNTGKGGAKNMRITSAQPEIIENEKGLLIEFQIIGAQVGNEPASKSLTVDLGDIEPDMTKVARWLMIASLQGKFIEYSATFEHVDSLGDPRLSLIESVDIYELIHVVLANRPEDDDLYDFLVNTVPGETSMPDELHLSDGTVSPVSVVTEAGVEVDIEGETMEVQISAQMPEGWGYLYISDPGEEQYKLVSAVDSQGRELLVDWNVWTTHRTFRPLGQPAYRRHRLHLLDCDGTGSYTLTYAIDWTVTDIEPPVSEVLPLEPVIRNLQFETRWTGEDNEDGSGIAGYDIYVSTDGGQFARWLRNTTLTGVIFTGAEDTTYAFYSVATDRAGNREFAPETAHTETYIPDLTPPVVSIELTPESDTGTFGDGFTRETLPAFIGQTEPLSHVFIDVAGAGGYEHFGVTTADDTGEWYYAIPAEAELPEGLIAVSASAIDQAGNESLLAAELTFTVDTTPPTASVDALPATLPYVLLLVSWSGEDAVAGLLNFDVYAAVDDGEFELWMSNTTETTAEFLGSAGSTYHFYCIARDHAGNIGEQPAEPQTSTLLTSPWELAGDADMDCTVNEADLIFVRNRLRMKVYHDDNYKADVVQDGSIDILDLVHVRNRMGTTCE